MESLSMLSNGRRWLGIAVIMGLLLSAAGNVEAQGAQGAVGRFASPAFERVWARYDAPVASGAVERSWVWGPGPFAAATEPYAEGAGGNRLVQYFDKSRMEITQPTANRDQPWFVTNGLLTKELVTGRLQIGHDQFIDTQPARIPVAGDPDSPDSPSYAAFRGVATISGDNRAPDRTGEPLDRAINGAGRVRTIEPRDTAPPYRFAHYEPATGHNILGAFWRFMTEQAGFDWVFVLGYPITEPYWAKVNLQGRETDVVVQLFERRVLTYTPVNPEAWRVEMGNIGRHYYQWRYQGTPPLPIVVADPATPGLPVHVRGFNWPAGGGVMVGIAHPDGEELVSQAISDTGAQGSFETTLIWTSALANAYARVGTNLVVRAVGPNDQQVTTPLQVGDMLTERLSGQVVDVARSARTLRVRMQSEVVKTLALTDQMVVRRPDGSTGSLADITIGTRVDAVGRPGGSGAMLTDLITIQTGTS